MESRNRLQPRATDVVVGQLIGVTILLVARLAGSTWVWSALIAVVTVVIATVPVRGWTAPRWCVVAATRGLDRRLPREQMSTRPVTRDDHIGVRWDGARVSAVLEVTSPRSGITRIDRARGEPDSRIPLDVLARCLGHHDLAPVAIDVTVHGSRLIGSSRASQAYGRLIGPLPAVAARTVWITVSLDVRSADSAIARRGGDLSAASHSVGVATARVDRALHGVGLHTRGLTSSEIDRARRSITGGAPESALHAQWNRVDGPGFTRVARGLHARGLATGSLEAIWGLPSGATTVGISLRRSTTDGSAVVGVTYAVTAPPASDRVTAAVPSSLSLAGRQRRALRMQTPGASASHDALTPTAELTAASLRSIVLATTGCGQLIGSDADGRGVAARLFGPSRSTVHVAGELFLIHQLVFRAIALGASVHVATDRPHAWYPLAVAVSDPRTLSVTDPSAPVPTAGPDLVVFDGIPDRPPSSVASTLYTAETPSQWPSTPADLTIAQPDCTGEHVAVTVGQSTEWVTLVTVGQEAEFIGRPIGPSVTRV